MRLLSIDFDFFFPLPDDRREQFTFYDWAQRDSMLFGSETLWYMRAEGFLLFNKPLPMTSGEEIGFWNSFKLAPGAKLFLADSHVYAYDRPVREALEPIYQSEVVNFDAHHDCGYGTSIAKLLQNKRVTCDNWMMGYSALGAKVRVVYPEWRRHSIADSDPSRRVRRATHKAGQRYSAVFDHVFICRSGAWVPTWIESCFWNFVRECPIKTKPIMLEDFKPRAFDLQRALDITQESKRALEDLRASKAFSK
jgi:hypothetical protein